MLIDASFLDQIIRSHRSAIRYYLLFAIGIFAVGVAVVIGAFLWPWPLIEGGIKSLLSIGGGFVSSLSAFQLKEILSRKEKVQVLETVRVRMHKLEEEELIDEGERTRIEELLWKLVEKTAMG